MAKEIVFPDSKNLVIVYCLDCSWVNCLQLPILLLLLQKHFDILKIHEEVQRGLNSMEPLLSKPKTDYLSIAINLLE